MEKARLKSRARLRHQNIFTGSGNLTDGFKQSKLEDSNSQIEIILNNNITRLCNNITAFAVMGIPDTHIEIKSEKKRRKRSIDNKPSGILRLAHRPNRCLAYPRSEYITKMSAEICAISGNLTDRALYANTVDRGQSFQFLESGYILATEEDYCLHAWEPDQIAAKQCIDFGRHTTTKHGPHKWMLTADPEENPLTPLMIINVDRNECLTTDNNNNTIYLAPCKCKRIPILHI